MRKRILAAVVSIVVVIAVFLSTAAVLPQSINVLGVSTTGNSSTVEAAPLANNMSEYENTIAAMINNVRVSNGLSPLAADSSLKEVADIRSQDLMNRNYFSHYTPEGTNVFDIMRSMGIGFSYAGENLAQSAPASAGTCEGFLNAWMNSPTHKDNILRAQYTKIGVSMVEIDSRRIVTTVFSN
jgi:uncharacterized protein YkwD